MKLACLQVVIVVAAGADASHFGGHLSSSNISIASTTMATTNRISAVSCDGVWLQVQVMRLMLLLMRLHLPLSIYLLFEGKFCSVCTQSRSIANRTAVGLLTAGNSNHNSDWLQM